MSAGPGRELVAAPGAAVQDGVLTVPGHAWAVYSVHERAENRFAGLRV